MRSGTAFLQIILSAPVILFSFRNRNSSSAFCLGTAITTSRLREIQIHNRSKVFENETATSSAPSSALHALKDKGHRDSEAENAGRIRTITNAEANTKTKANKARTNQQQYQNPIRVFGIDHVVLLVDDLAGMAEWYETVLGCRVAKRNEKFQMIHLDAGSALIDLVDNAGPLGKNQTRNENSNDCETKTNCDQKMDHICLGLTNFDEEDIRRHLAVHGVTITTDIGVRYGKGGYGESLYFQDPEGTRIEIKKTKMKMETHLMGFVEEEE